MDGGRLKCTNVSRLAVQAPVVLDWSQVITYNDARCGNVRRYRCWKILRFETSGCMCEGFERFSKCRAFDDDVLTVLHARCWGATICCLSRFNLFYASGRCVFRASQASQVLTSCRRVSGCLSAASPLFLVWALHSCGRPPSM